MFTHCGKENAYQTNASPSNRILSTDHVVSGQWSVVNGLLLGSVVCFVLFRVISWIVCLLPLGTIHEITRNNTKQTTDH